MEKMEHGANPNDVATPKNEFTKELFADMFSYYVRNVNALTKDELEDFKRLDKAANSTQLKNWAENIHISGSAGDMTSIELANVIRSTDDKTLDALILDIQKSLRIINEKANAINSQTEKEKQLLPENTAILFHNGEGNFTALGEDADKLTDELALMTDSNLGEIPALNINRAGVALLKHNNIPFKIVDPVTDLAVANGTNNDITKDNLMLMQMGHLAVLSKGELVRFDTKEEIFGNEKSMELEKGLYRVTLPNPQDKMELNTLPIRLFSSQDGKNESYGVGMTNEETLKLRAFFNDNYDELKKTVNEYAFVRKELDKNLKSLIEQNDRLTMENPDTIILIKQRGFIEAFSDSAINAANTLGLSLYNRTDHKNSLSIPYTRMTVEDYKKLYETDNNVYLARPDAPDKMTDAKLAKVNPQNIPLAQRNPNIEQSEKSSIKR